MMMAEAGSRPGDRGAATDRLKRKKSVPVAAGLPVEGNAPTYTPQLSMQLFIQLSGDYAHNLLIYWVYSFILAMQYLFIFAKGYTWIPQILTTKYACWPSWPLGSAPQTIYKSALE